MKFVLYPAARRSLIDTITEVLLDLDDSVYEVIIKPYDTSRSSMQNRLQHQWMNDLERHGDMTAGEYRAVSKLCVGVPLLRAESLDFKEKYDRIIRPLDYTAKLELMAEPFDFPVTRLMTVEQMSKYLTQLQQFWNQKGFNLTGEI